MDGSRPDTSTLVVQWSTNGGPLGGFGEVVALARAAGGPLVVAERSGRIVELDADGGGMREIVPAALSAGEPTALEATVSDIWVLYGSAGELARFGMDGTEQGRWRLGAPTQLRGRQALVNTGTNGIWIGLGPDSIPGSGRAIYARWDATGPRGDTLRLPPTDEACVDPDPYFAAGWYEDFRVRYLPMVRWSLTPDGRLVYGCSASYRFEVRIVDRGAGAQGPDWLRVTRRAWRPAVVPAQERLDFVATWTALMNNRPGHPPGWRWKGPRPTDRKPAFMRFLPGRGGEVWVWPGRPSVPLPSNPSWPLAGLPETLWSENRTGTFDVFGPDGALTRHVTLPDQIPYTPFPDTAEPLIEGDTVWVVLPHADGRDAVARTLVRPGARPS